MVNIQPFKKIIEFDSFISKRVKFFISSAIYFFLLLTYILFGPSFQTLDSALKFSLLSIVFLIYPLAFGLKRSNFFKVLSVPVALVLSGFLLLTFFPNLNIYFKFMFVLFSTFLFYFLLLSINIFLVVEEKGRTIPLLRPAKTTFLFIEVAAIFLVFTAFFKMLLPDPFTELTFVFQSSLIGLTAYLFTDQYWWSQNLEKEVTSFVGNETLTIAYLLFIGSLGISFVSTESFFKALALSTLFYVCISFFQSVVTHKLSKSQYVEYLVIGIIVIIFLILG